MPYSKPIDPTDREPAAEPAETWLGYPDDGEECPVCNSALGLTFIERGRLACIFCGWVQPVSIGAQP